jgi:hypothetical protein
LSKTTRTPLHVLADWLRPPASFRRSVARDASAYAESLLVINTSRLINDAIERVHESRRLLAAEIRRKVKGSVEIGTSALDRAKEALAEGADAVAREIARLEGIRSRLTMIEAGASSRDGS